MTSTSTLLNTVGAVAILKVNERYPPSSGSSCALRATFLFAAARYPLPLDLEVVGTGKF